ncbi:hypothetical protein F2P81_005670 [Scophthalmus maximus]|uniref:Fizzy-related protein homolog n=2 Tax=Scophthalmus maximus TaxID=52904 RepID=A0A6A4TCL0_SCOMX|nr:hypothetical protein F2P81_005670 [Scophthalmus maximus]
MDPEYEHRLLRQINIQNDNLSPVKSTHVLHCRTPTGSPLSSPSKLGDRFIPTRAGANWNINFHRINENEKSPSQNRKSKDATSDNIKADGLAYSALLKNELLGAGIEKILDPQTEDRRLQPSTPEKKSLFMYSLNTKRSSPDNSTNISPYSLSPVSNKSQKLLRSPRKPTRKISKIPFKVLDAPELQDDFYLNLVDWSSLNVLSVGLGTCVYLWSACTSQVTRLCDLSVEGDSVTSVGWSERGNMVAVGTHKGYVQIWDAGAGKKLFTLEGHTARVGALAWNADQLSSGSRDRMILQRDIRSPPLQSERRLQGHRQEVCGLKWSTDHQLLASGGNDNKLLVWNHSSLSPVQTYVDHLAAVKAIAWSPHQHGLLASGGGTADRCIRFWNTLTSQPLQCMDTGSQVCNLAWSKHANELVSTHGYSQNQILVWKYPALTQVAKLTGHSYRVLYLAMSPDGEAIVTGAGDETLRFWNVFSKTRSTKESVSVLNLFTRIRYKVLQDKEMKQAEGQSEAAKQRELQRKIEQLKAEISHLDSQISGTEEQLATQEQSISRTWAQVEDSQRRELLLQAFRQSCVQGCKMLSDDTQKISGHCQALEQMARKAEMEVLFDEKSSSNSDGDKLNSKTTAEAQVLRQVRELCDDRVHFYQSLQESELKTAHSASKHVTREQRTAMFQYWLSAVESVLDGYPPNHVLSALQYLASREQKELEDKLHSLDVTRDVTALRFRYESNHLLDMSAEEDNELPPVKALLQDAWEEVEQSLLELAQTRSRVQQLKNQLQARRKEAEQEISVIADELHNDTLALSVVELELQCVMQAAARDHIRNRCIQLDQHARSRQEALRNLRSQWQSILDFRQLVVLRQEQIRGLIKGNSTAKTELIHLQRELQELIQSKLVPQFEDVTTAANSLRNSISKDVRQFGMVSLLALDCRTVEGIQRIPASSLSIHRLQSSTVSSLCQSLAFPLYMAPEELCLQARSQKLELRFLRQLLQLHSASLQKIQKETEMLHASDQKALLSRVVEDDQKLLKCLLPRVRGLTQRCAQGLSYGDQVKTAISYW